jgi:hypothetical protein
MSWRLNKPRHISTYEKRIVRRVLEVGSNTPPCAALVASVEKLIVHEEGDGHFHRDSLSFNSIRKFGYGGSPVAMALGTMSNDATVELIVWAQGGTITALELEPFNGTRLPIRMPIVESIRPYPEI